MKNLTIYFLMLLLPTFGCQRQDDPNLQPASSSSNSLVDKLPAKHAVPILSGPMQISLVEIPTDALATWRIFREQKPVLIILSDDPFLVPIPQQVISEAETLILQGQPQDFRAKVAPFTSAPVLLPSMAVSAGIQTRLFSKIIWVIPSTETTSEKISVTTFKQQLRDYGTLSQDDIDSFTQSDSGFRGQVRGLPFEAVYPFALSKLQTPSVVHIDLSFFRPFYKNEISTPLLPILYGSLEQFRQAEWPTYAVTISYSNLTADLPLESRFIGNILQSLFGDPSLLAKQPKPNWLRQKDILYLENLFQSEKVLELALAMESESPNDASVQFALYQAYRGSKDGDKALVHLGKTVELDHTYGLEYLNLAPLATQKGRPDEAIRMLKLAAETFPDNPFIPIELAKAHLHLGQKEEAIKLIESASKMSWSPVYYPDMSRNLTDFSSKLQALPIPNQTKQKPGN